MTSPDDPADPAQPAEEPGEPTTYADRVYRSPGGIVGGVLLLGLGGWLGIDAILRGEGRTPWLALAGLLFAVPVVIAFTVRPAVYAGADRLLVRNPFRTITLPWGSVDTLRAGYTSEVLAGGATYQLWAVPVSLRQRKRAARQQSRDAAAGSFGRTPGVTGRASGPGATADRRAQADQTIGDLRELAESHASRDGAQGEPEVRWAFEVIAPTLAGAVLLVIMLLI
ncbi:PH domain-containing protein [Streptomyces sp. NBRC 110028]|uniref:PH domain-containing protein n=1 Tax=Streptomyces sp. NBRC 110028 TaxID=1621260 RepID=UPI000AAA22B3|nr:PH domain-containing protein [Streptomyces sp. NBRC 110028]